MWVLAPALAAIVLAVITRQVLPSLAIGILVGAFMMLPCSSAEERFGDSYALLSGIRLAVETYVIGAMADADHIKVILFSLIIGSMVGVVAANGGTQAMVKAVIGWASSPKRVQLTGWLAGLVVFFDDYANTMIVGPTMRPICDRMGISRAKLAYIVDSTAAPVASIALIGTWVGSEVGFIQSGFDNLQATGTPAFLDGVNAASAFFYSIPYRFYPILAIVLVALIALTGRDFGPMKRRERHAAESARSQTDADQVDGDARRWWLAGLPIGVLVCMTMAIIYATGRAGISPGQPHTLKSIISNADAYNSILYGAILAAVVAVAVTLLTRACKVKDTVEAGIEGMTRMFPAMVVLVLAWALSKVSQDLHLGHVATQFLKQQDFAPQWLPLSIFISAAVVSFAMGSSWGTMGILCPVAVTVAAQLGTQLDPAQAIDIFYASVGSVLAGAVFGDHCSPISDTTVLSSVATECTLEEHVWTQLPYALTAAVVGIVAGNMFCAWYHQPYWLGLLMGTAALVVVVFVVGRRVAQPS